MIKGIILDVDGVIVGQKKGINTPVPHQEVIKALQRVRKEGIFISLCTAKPYFAIDNIIKLANLDNLHIADGGSVIIDPINSVIVKKSVINNKTAGDVIRACVDNDIYTEFYNGENYFIEKKQYSEITKKHTFILQKEPIKVDSLVEESALNEITKIMPIAKDEKEKERITELLSSFGNELIIYWGIHPVVLPLQFGVITPKGISKKQAAIQIAEHYNVSFENILGVGDSMGDWEFIQLCNFAGTVKNAEEELIDLIKQKGEGKFFIGKSVDENGILDVIHSAFQL